MALSKDLAGAVPAPPDVQPSVPPYWAEAKAELMRRDRIMNKLIPQFGNDGDLTIDCAYVLVERGRGAPDSVFKAMLVQLKTLPENERPPIYPKLLAECQKRAGDQAAKKDE